MMNRIRTGEAVTLGLGSALLRHGTENVQILVIMWKNNHKLYKYCKSSRSNEFFPSLNMFAISKSSRIFRLGPRTNKRSKEFAVAGRRVHYCSTKTTTKSLLANNQKAAVFSANGMMTWRVGAGAEREISDNPAL